jgi:hypothetical protein
MLLPSMMIPLTLHITDNNQARFGIDLQSISILSDSSNPFNQGVDFTGLSQGPLKIKQVTTDLAVSLYDALILYVSGDCLLVIFQLADHLGIPRRSEPIIIESFDFVEHMVGDGIDDGRVRSPDIQGRGWSQALRSSTAETGL